MIRKGTAPRIVLDTNLVVSALVFAQGRSAALRNLWHAKRCHPLVSKVTVAELIRVLAYPKFRLSEEGQQELLADYLPYCTTVRMSGRRPRIPKCRDPFDAPFLELALTGKADFLVTGDRDLLSLAGNFHCPIITADDLLSKLCTEE